MRVSSNQLKKILGLSVNKSFEFDNLGKLSSKNGKKILSYIENEKFLELLESNNSISAVFATKSISKKIPKLPTIICNEPKFQFCKFHNYLCNATDFYQSKIKWKSKISLNSTLNSNHISNSNVKIGPSTIIEAGSVIYPNVKIGKNCTIMHNSIIGEAGIELAKKSLNQLKFEFDGGVILGDGVYLQSNVSIKKGLFGTNTKISDGTMLGSFVNIGHGTIIGKDSYLAPGVIVAGSSKIGNNCFLGVNSTVVNGVKIGHNCKIGAGTIITKNIPSNKIVVGNPGKIIGIVYTGNRK